MMYLAEHKHRMRYAELPAKTSISEQTQSKARSGTLWDFGSMAQACARVEIEPK